MGQHEEAEPSSIVPTPVEVMHYSCEACGMCARIRMSSRQMLLAPDCLRLDCKITQRVLLE